MESPTDESSTAPTWLSPRRLLALLLILLGLLLTITIVPGVFIIDEDNYLVTVVGLRHGQLTVPGTENLTPSNELAWFDPEAGRRVILSTPVVSLVPSLYAFVALPFSFGGWRGLTLLNIISFLVAIYLVFRYAEELTRHRAIPWIAAVLFGLGSYCIEYAQGVWPEMLSVALCIGTLWLCLKARKHNSFLPAFIAGILIGISIGVREQNILFAGCVGIGLLFYSLKRVKLPAAYALGVIVVLIAIATINQRRVGIWHPFPKLGGYAQQVTANAEEKSALEPLRVIWSKVVDYSSYGSNTDHIKSGLYQWDSDSGTILLNGIVRKSWIQSSPWIALALVLLIACWFRRRNHSSEVERESRVLSIVVLPVLAMFVAAGFNRTDGLSFNQRYFLELVPLCALTVAMQLDRTSIRITPAAIGFGVGIMLVVIALLLPTTTARYLAQRFVPIVLGFGLVGAFYAAVSHRSFFLVLGACAGWAFFIHIESDLVGSRFRREINASSYAVLDGVVTNHSALFTYWGNKDAAGPLQLNRDVVILDVRADEGKDAELLERELLAQHRAVFVLENDMPDQIRHQLLDGRQSRQFLEGSLRVTEIFDR